MVRRERERKREKLPRCVMIQVKFALARHVHIGTPVPLANVQRSIKAEPWCIDYRISIGRVQYVFRSVERGFCQRARGASFILVYSHLCFYDSIKAYFTGFCDNYLLC